MALSEYYRLAAENARKALKGLNMGGRDIYEMEQEADEYYANVNASLEFIKKHQKLLLVNVQNNMVMQQRHFRILLIFGLFI